MKIEMKMVDDPMVRMVESSNFLFIIFFSPNLRSKHSLRLCFDQGIGGREKKLIETEEEGDEEYEFESDEEIVLEGYGEEELET